MSEIAPAVVHPSEVTHEAWDGLVVWRTLLDGDRTPTRNVVVGLATVSPGAATHEALHHHDADEVYVITAGTGHVLIDGTRHEVGPGSTIFLPAGCEHAASADGPEPLELTFVLLAHRFEDVNYSYVNSPPAHRRG